MPVRIFLLCTTLYAAVNAGDEISTFTGTCSQKSCTNILATYDTHDNECGDNGKGGNFSLQLTNAVAQLYVKASQGAVTDVTVKFGTRSYETANAASDECTADSLAHGLACYATCSAGTVTSDGWTTCVIEGFGGQDTFDALNYYTYISGKGTEGVTGCPNDDPDVCPYMFVTAKSSTYVQNDDITPDNDLGFEFRSTIDFQETCQAPPCQAHTFTTDAEYDCNNKGCTINFPLKYGKEDDVIQYDPDKCNITYALLGLGVKGQYGGSFDEGKPKIFVGESTSIAENSEIDTSAIQCPSDGTQCLTEWQTCLHNYDLLENVPGFTIEPADGTLLIVDVESDNTIDKDDGCLYFSANTSLTYSYVCECAPTPAPTTPSPSPKPSYHPTPKPSYAPSVAPFPAPTPNPTFEPTEACRENKTVFEHQEQLNKNGEFGVDTHATFSNEDRVCTLETATLYTAFDTVVTDPSQINDVSVAIAPQDLTFAKAVWDDQSPDNVCTDEMFKNGKACYASCGAYTDDSPDQHDQPGWPDEFTNWETYSGVNYQSCNEFYGIDVTQYLMYTDGNLTACADESIAGDYTKCPALGSYFYSKDYEGGEQGDPEFQVIQDLYMDVVCHCIPDGDEVKMARSMACDKVGDCPVKFVFPRSTDGFNVTVSFDANKCTTDQLQLSMQSKAYRDAVPTVKANGVALPAAEIQCGNNLPTTGTITDGCPEDDATAWDTCLVDKLIQDKGDTDVLLTMDISQSNCEDSEVYAVLDWTYSCGHLLDDDDGSSAAMEAIKPAMIEYEKKHKGLLNGKKSVPVKQNVKMRLRGR